MNDWIPQLIRALEILGVAAIVAIGGIISAILQHRANMKRLRFEQRFKVGEYRYKTFEEKIKTHDELLSGVFSPITSILSLLAIKTSTQSRAQLLEEARTYLSLNLPILREAPIKIEANLKEVNLIDPQSQKEIEDVQEAMRISSEELNESNIEKIFRELRKAISTLQRLEKRFLEKKRDEIFNNILQ